MSDEQPLESNPSSGGAPIHGNDQPEFNEIEVLTQEAQDALARATTADVEEDDDDSEEDEDDDEDDDDDDDDDDDEDFVANLPPFLRHRVEKLKDLDKERDAIRDVYLKERAVLENKFAALYKPLYEQRRSMISSTNVDENQTDDDGEEIAGVPGFWTGAMENIETIEELITERDNECLGYLEDIRCNDFEDCLGFTLEFEFKENPFFKNKLLTKKYDVPNLLIDDEPILKNVIGCDIEWKDDNCLTHRTITKKQRNKKGQIRHVKKKEKLESFFHFFCPPKLPSMDEMDEEQADAIEEAFDHDYEVAQSFRKHIVPKGVLWFTGEAIASELEGIYENGESLLSPKDFLNTEAVPDGSPFPKPVEGSEEPECKQS